MQIFRSELKRIGIMKHIMKNVTNFPFFNYRHLSESESSLEMEEERVYNELSHASVALAPTPGATLTGPGHAHAVQVHRTRTVSSPVPVVGGLNVSGPSPQSAASIPSTSRPLSPGT